MVTMEYSVIMVTEPSDQVGGEQCLFRYVRVCNDNVDAAAVPKEHWLASLLFTI